MSYLLALQKAIAQTQPDDTTKMLGDEYLTGWTDVEWDLSYCLELNSETAAREHLSLWTESERYGDWTANTQGYIDRLFKISEILLDTPIQSA